MSCCAQCGAAFECGMADTATEQPCWCTRLPPLPRDAIMENADTKMGCLCPSCLRTLLAAQQMQGRQEE